MVSERDIEIYKLIRTSLANNKGFEIYIREDNNKLHCIKFYNHMNTVTLSGEQAEVLYRALKLTEEGEA